MVKSIPFITDEQVRKLLPMSEAIELMKEAFTQLTNKVVSIPERINLDMPEVNADSLIMPVYSAEEKKYGVKIVSLNRNNPEKNLPFIHALMILFDAENGKPLVIFDAENLTAIRTGAASGLATELLSVPNASVMALFGAGIQAKYQLRAIREVRDIGKVLLIEKNDVKAISFKDEMEQEGNFKIQIAKEQGCLGEAQIICTATTSAVPVFQEDLVSEGTHINAIGSYQPSKREIPSGTIKNASIFVDSKEACLSEAGDIIIPLNEGNDIRISEIGELIQNKKTGRKSKSELTVFKSVGSAAQDLICAIHIFKKLK